MGALEAAVDLEGMEALEAAAASQSFHTSRPCLCISSLWLPITVARVEMVEMGNKDRLAVILARLDPKTVTPGRLLVQAVAEVKEGRAAPPPVATAVHPH